VFPHEDDVLVTGKKNVSLSPTLFPTAWGLKIKRKEDVHLIRKFLKQVFITLILIFLGLIIG
jgi:hypothetical protein